MTTLEQQMADLCQRHGLKGLSLHFQPDGAPYAFVHREGMAGMTPCGERSGIASDAIKAALADLDRKEEIHTPLLDGLAA